MKSNYERDVEKTVIIDEIYLIAMQTKIRLMHEALEKIHNADDVFCLSDAQYEAGLVLDKINQM